MKYLSLEHRLVRYFGKLDGVLMLAHLNVLKPQGNDYAALLDIKGRRQMGEAVSEIIPWTDGEFDEAKVRDLFIERFGDTAAAFDQVIATGRSLGYIDPVKLAPTPKAIAKFQEIETDRKNTLTQLGYDGAQPLFIWLEGKNKQTKDAVADMATKEYSL